MIMTATILEVKNLKKYYPIRKGLIPRPVGFVKAVSHFECNIKAGETVGLVGESGCGKTTVGRTILRLVEPTAGEVFFKGKNIFTMGRQEMKKHRQKMQIIFQDPYDSLNPRMTVGKIVGDAMLLHGIVKREKEKNEKVSELLERVGLSSKYINRYPHEFSGGQRQRIGIARALALNPEFIVCDEAVSALDVSIQAQILKLLKDLQNDFGISYLFISHDLAVVKHIAKRIIVMYLGEIVEKAPTEELFKNPLHPYTKALLSAIPSLDPEKKSQRQILYGDVPSPINPPSGCYFHPRCPMMTEHCKIERPLLKNYGNDHWAACHNIVPR